MKKRFLSLIAAGLMLGGTSQIQAMDLETALLSVATGAVIIQRNRVNPQEYNNARTCIQDIKQTSDDETIQYSVTSSYRMNKEGTSVDKTRYFVVRKATVEKYERGRERLSDEVPVTYEPCVLENWFESIESYRLRLQTQQYALLDQACKNESAS